MKSLVGKEVKRRSASGRECLCLFRLHISFLIPTHSSHNPFVSYGCAASTPAVHQPPLSLSFPIGRSLLLFSRQAAGDPSISAPPAVPTRYTGLPQP